ncbi:hypothetical protein GBAG_3178 [Buttiauxella agrestis ATCC 33320]|uniref:Uncharacterized protein n=1 Tax=Buttiauxella agrestis ATCC 33320 TaxID=1006004 RepID=A0A085G4T7_9ENTR|nr:hypothetical protein GBAG_3178 [Buttiauxella agrestis ATCC 33320]
MKTNIITGSEMSRLSVAIQIENLAAPLLTLNSKSKVAI